MLKISSMKQVVLFVLIIFCVVLFSTIAGAAKTPDKGASQEWAVIDGFRSAKFGYKEGDVLRACLLYTSPSPRDRQKSRMPSSA